MQTPLSGIQDPLPHKHQYILGVLSAEVARQCENIGRGQTEGVGIGGWMREIEYEVVPGLFVQSLSSSRRPFTNVRIRPIPAQNKRLKETALDRGCFCLPGTSFSFKMGLCQSWFLFPFLK